MKNQSSYYMKHIYPSLMLAAALLTGAQAQASHPVVIKDATMQLDTIFHAKVGPGTTQTQLRLIGDTYGPLDVFYLTVDLRTPGVTMRAVTATDHVAGCQRTSAMAEGKSHAGVTYFCGTNGDFYTTSGTATNGTSKVGSPTTSCTVDGEVIKTSNSNYQFSFDADGIARVCRLNYYTGTATIGDKVTLFKGINVGAPNNGITIYTPRYWGSTNQTDYTDNCYEVTARLVEGDAFLCGGKYRMEITSEPNRSGDTPVPADGFVIFGRGNSTSGCNTGALDFVGSLHTGDIVEFDNIVLTPDKERIYPRQIVSGNPKNVGLGEILDTEGERTDASARHPRTSIGVSSTGDSIIMMVIDGRTGRSVGVTTSVLGAVMRYAGAYEAVNLDGGGSSTLYTRALGVRNHCSDGTERAVGNAIFAVVEADESDTEVAEIHFRDWAVAMPSLGLYTPVIYAYNKAGLLIDTNYQGYTLSCPESLGTIVNDGHTLYTNGSGTWALTATAPGAETITLPITIDNTNIPAPKYEEVVLDNVRQWTIELQALVGQDYLPVAPMAFEWTSSDPSIASVTSDGTVTGHANGTVTLTGTFGPDFSIAQTVRVEVPETQVMALDPNLDVTTWTVSKTSVSDIAVTPLDNGVAVDYTVSATRGTKITLGKKINAWSLPKELLIRFNPGTAKVGNVMLTVRPQNETRTVSYTFDQIATGEVNELRYVIADNLPSEDIGIFPIEFVSLSFAPTDAAKTQCHVEIPGIEAVYESGAGVDRVSIDELAASPVTLDRDGRTVRVPAKARTLEVYDSAGRLVATATDTDCITVPRGIYGVMVVKAITAEGLVAGKVALNR